MSKIVTYETVVESAEVLVAEGKKPSVRAVIATLGGGSPNTVLLHLNRWKVGLPPAPVRELRLDPKAVRILSEQLTKATAEACAETEQKLAVAEENALAVAEAGEKAERDLLEVRGKLEQLAIQVAAQSGVIDQLRTDATKAEKDLAGLREQLAEEQRARIRAEADRDHEQARAEDMRRQMQEATEAAERRIAELAAAHAAHVQALELQLAPKGRKSGPR